MLLRLFVQSRVPKSRKLELGGNGLQPDTNFLYNLPASCHMYPINGGCQSNYLWDFGILLLDQYRPWD
jgi:hypothetical protein